MRATFPVLISSLLVVVCAPAAFSQEAQTNESQPTACSSEQARHFDFWIGEWEVHARGKVAGKSQITSLLDGCVIYEQYDGVNGYSGKSMNVFDSPAGKWRQFWMDNQGGLLQLEGGYEKDKMVLSGPSILQGKEVRSRITWKANADKSVSQHWEISKDGGKTWETAFDGRYTHRN